MRTHQHDILRRLGGGLSDDVLGAHMLGAGVDDESRVTRSGSQLRSISPADTRHGNRDVIVLQKCPAERLLLDVVGDDQSRRAASGRSGRLIGEVAATAINQDHRPRDRQAVVVGGLTARCVGRRDRDEQSGDPGRRSGAAVLHCPRGHRCPVDGQRFGVDVKDAQLELGGLHIEALVLQCFHHIVDTGRVSGGPRLAGAAVAIGDVLEQAQVRHDRIGGDGRAKAVRVTRTVFGRRAVTTA